MSDLKLTIELGKPAYAQNKTVRNSIPRSLWNALRHHLLEKSDYKCQICGFAGGEKLQAHEVWEYDEEKFLLILKDVQSLCKSCHDLKHIRHVEHRIKDRQKRDFVMKNLMKHFMRVNGCTENEFRMHYRNQSAKNKASQVNRSLDDLIEKREDLKREAFLLDQDWRFVIAENLPYEEKIKSHLSKKGLLYER
ncbi:hypothetical protein [Halobacillus yeomjeoni]|uniref:HNH endonuclease n=1 Tax=Halobacillus yeomjeoni TaxID=311194 RepID=A0A931MTR2_9BACI|nr:hypothetical protein [Halobacillus yeomjeoni]MBH0229108.1 hypothetical protein [Halobacillus yeomjeoni]